ncbi:class I SAM-dependent methyltransferase [Streptomyces sp. MAR4 CNX-425]|uniref:class I SAM-dependent methyltransferase n=1 Tax=Streptomyces sp. MAR4 CNX-425 TaxID=3406343 RepID=UPI003B50EF20
MSDPYRESAEFLDIMSRDNWRVIGPRLDKALAPVDPSTGPVVDLGAGTGLGTLTIAAALPGAEILAVEPSPGLRAVLLSRVYDDADLARRVTVLDTDAQHADLPERLAAVVAMNMIGHLDRGERRTLWASLARRLAPSGRIVVNLQPPADPVSLPDTRFCAIPIGRRSYEGWGRAEPTGPDSVTWHMRYRLTEAGVPIRERTVDYPWWILTESALRAETAEAGLTTEPFGRTEERLYVICKQPTP